MNGVNNIFFLIAETPSARSSEAGSRIKHLNLKSLEVYQLYELSNLI